MPLSSQFAWLFVLSMPVATISWVITREEIFREPREYCKKCSLTARQVLARKFFYVFTCEFCLSHYVALVFLFVARFHLLFDNWRGYLIAWFSVVWVANFYMGLFGLLRTDLKSEQLTKQLKERALKGKGPAPKD